DAVAAETASVAVEEGSIYTKKMNAKADERNDLIIGFEHLVENGLRHYDSAKRDASEHIVRVLNVYGNINKKSKTEKTTTIRNLTHDLLSAENAPFLTLLDGTDWITKLQVVNEEVDTIYLTRNDEETERISGDVRAARAVTDPVFKAIVEKINAGVIVNGEANYLHFINQLNGIVKDLITNLNSGKGGSDKPDVPETPTSPAS
ncbi:MAG: DUF6261 family protein, partial [Paludibacter sp.]